MDYRHLEEKGFKGTGASVNSAKWFIQYGQSIKLEVSSYYLALTTLWCMVWWHELTASSHYRPTLKSYNLLFYKCNHQAWSTVYPFIRYHLPHKHTLDSPCMHLNVSSRNTCVTTIYRVKSEAHSIDMLFRSRHNAPANVLCCVICFQKIEQFLL